MSLLQPRFQDIEKVTSIVSDQAHKALVILKGSNAPVEVHLGYKGFSGFWNNYMLNGYVYALLCDLTGRLPNGKSSESGDN